VCAIGRVAFVICVACLELLRRYASGVGLVSDEVIGAAADERDVTGRELQWRSLIVGP
jgi:hypothetical protein